MEEGRPSQTAQMAALLRAAHLLIDGKPKLLVDELAGEFLGIDSKEALRHSLERSGGSLATESDFVPLDFETQSLVEGLRAGGYDSEKPAFISWQGHCTLFFKE